LYFKIYKKMKKFKNKINYLFISLSLFYLLFYSCAQISSPTGGPQDTIAPRIIKSLPNNKDTGFNNNVLELKFDEYVQLNDISVKFFSSPPFLEIPEFHLRGKSLIIKLNEPLKDTTTYTFYFANSVKDFNEGNELKNLNLVFSTGGAIDSFSVSGHVYTAFNMEKAKDIFVMLYKNFTDSIPYKETPYFVAKTDTSGYFYIKNIKIGDYKVFGLLDMNNNLIYDMPNESICFLDSIVKAKVAVFEHFDTLKNKKYIYDTDSITVIDSIYNDSIVRIVENIYSPDNLKLYVFAENRKKQFVSSTQRSRRGMCAFKFNRELDENYQIRPLNFETENFKIQKFVENDSLIYWLFDNDLKMLDSLNFEITYQQLDSLDNFFTEKDTSYFVYKKPDADSIYNKFETNLSATFDLFKPLEITTSVPIAKIDTSKIKIFMLKDSLVETDMTQRIVKAQRQDKNLLVFTFAQPLVNEPRLEFASTSELDTIYKINLNAKRDSLVVTILDDKISENEKISFYIYYDNNYFLSQYQLFKAYFNLKIMPQSVVYKNRKTQNNFDLIFVKNVDNDLSLKLLNVENIENWYTLNFENNIVNFEITNDLVKEKDTLLVAIKSNDYTDFDNKQIYFNDTISIIFERQTQTISEAYRDLKNHFVLKFNKPLNQEPEIKLLNENLNNWFVSDYKNNATEIEYTVNNLQITKQNELKFTVQYSDIDKNDSTKLLIDTLKLTTIKREKSENANKKNVKIEIEKDFTFKGDTFDIKKYYIEFNQKPDSNYVLKIDSMAFTDFSNLYNDTLDYKFKIYATDYYGNLILNIKNLALISYNELEFDKIKNDTINNNFNKLTNGQAIVQIWDANETKILYEYFITESQSIKIENLMPQTFVLKIVYDKNNNKKWDTGKYLKHEQVEKVFYYKSVSAIKSNFDTEIDWKLESY